MGYSAELSARVAEMRSRIRGETAALLNTSIANRREYLGSLMQELHGWLASEKKDRQEQAQALASALAAECAERRADVEQMLAQDAELRASQARAEQSMRRAAALSRAARLAALREDLQQMMDAAHARAEQVRSQLAHGALSDQREREAFMESLREQVRAMADAFWAAHLARCAESAQRRSGLRAMLQDFMSGLTGRPDRPCDAHDEETLSRSQPGSDAAQRP